MKSTSEFAVKVRKTGERLAIASMALLPYVASAQSTIDNSGNPPSTTAKSTNLSITLNNPLNGVSTIPDFMGKVIDAMLLVLTPVVVIMFIYSGFLFVTSASNEETKKKARTTLLYTVIGAAVILGAKGIALAVQNTVTQF